ncbi:hypothetical protein KR222_011163 [Zaprionus bogoriensis]|nr:hypothetical protein KR222_011163 [Zaprionus bogoriensis]
MATQRFAETNGTIIRGCVTDETCVAPSCLTCDTEKCNAFLLCSQCDGSQEACSTSNATEASFNRLCTSASQVCLNQVNENGTVTRGCGEPCATTDDGKCLSCSTDKCNVGIFPEARRQCYQCTGETCNDVADTMLKPCAKYATEGQQCYTIGSDAKTMVRGCDTDAGATCAAGSTNASCAFCSDQSGCNNRTYSSVLGSCIKCNNSDTCVLAQDASKAESCAAANYTQSGNSCYYNITTSGTVVRGCYNELSADETCDEAAGCKKCEGSACNVEAGIFTCLTCRSDNYEPCRQAAVGGTPCVNSSLTSPSSLQCYEGEWDNVVVRGCLIDLGQLMTYQCKNDADDRCEICSGIDCNKEVDRFNGAASLGHLSFGLLALIPLLVRQLQL